MRLERMIFFVAHIVFTKVYIIYTKYIFCAYAIYNSDVKEADGKCLNGKP